MLLGRSTECERVDELLERTRAGKTGVLTVHGEPGIGKTALLRYAHERARGLTVIRASGTQSELELPFAALSQLLEPLVDRRHRLPAPQAAALESALALGPPVPGDAFAVAAGALGLLADAAQESPVLVIVDDVHWLDAGSGAALRFVLRRIEANGIGVLAGVRDGEPSALDGLGLPELRLEGLEHAAARALLDRWSVRRVAPGVVRRLVEATAGNPLALMELPALLGEGQLSGAEPLPDPLPVAPSLHRAFELRLAALPRTTRQALVVAAASDSGGMTSIAGALTELGLAIEMLEPAEVGGLVSLAHGLLEWRHPLLRSTVYHGASTFERRAAHAALATASTGGERAWHRATATLGQDESVASELEEAALNARLRRGHAAAAVAFERAAELSVDSDASARRALEAARDHHLAGGIERARSLTQAALRTVRDPTVRVDLQHQLGVIETWGGDSAMACDLLVEAAAAIETDAPMRAATILVDAAIACQMSGDVDRTLRIARRAYDLAPAGDASPAEIERMLLNAMILAGEARTARPRLLKLVEASLADGKPTAGSVLFAATLGQAAIWLGEHAIAHRLFDRELRAARLSGSLALMPFLLACLSDLELRVGRWHSAYALGSESVRVAEETGQRNVLCFSLVSLARVEAATGRETDCRTHAARGLELGEELGSGSIRVYAMAALGLLELGLGASEAAATRLELLAELVESLRLREPGVVQWAPDLIEAQVLCGRVDEARGTLAAFEAQAEHTENAWARAAAARARGMLAEHDFDREFEVALRASRSPFERARTELRLGERLRRARRPTDARAPLRAALATFETLGARGWAEQASAELAAAGARVRRRDALATPVPIGELTQQELRIALLVAEGATNREAATALFLSPKTVGYHLGKVYAKLGVRSRTELAHVLARG